MTAHRFDRTCRWESWRLRARPFVLAVGASGLLALIVNVVGFPSYEPPRALLPALAVLVNAVVVANLLPAALRSRHHPRLVGYVVLLRGVDREAAQSWAALHPRGTIEIVDQPDWSPAEFAVPPGPKSARRDVGGPGRGA
ncbi:hypothetical protein [Melissospora conviva]|uniref:hypothetical protein n=1 Tax=Melissospora conviva TaxID=3388432 RepID=UPI003B7A97FC